MGFVDLGRGCILITGARGFVGTRLRAALRSARPKAQIVGTSAAPQGSDDLHQLDLLDASAVDALVGSLKPDTVIHLAAQASVSRGARDADATWQVNLGASLNIAIAVARHVPSATLLFTSTAEVYGASFLRSPVSELSVLSPMNAYAKSKLAAERVMADVLPSTSKLIIVRPFNHTGRGQREDFVLPSFAGQVARIEAGLQEPRMDVGNLDVRRDFLDVRDVIDAYRALMAAAPSLPARFICNVASGHARSLRDILETLRGLARVPFEVAIAPERLRPVDLPIASGDATLLKALTGWSPRWTIEETLRDLLDHARSTIAETTGA